MPIKIADETRIDPRIRKLFGASQALSNPKSVKDRDELLAEENNPEALAAADALKAFLDSMDSETTAPSTGLIIWTESLHSQPDGNTINIQFIRPDTPERLPCVYYIHGGGMASLSCYDGNYRAFGRLIAANGVAVAMVDFRNAVRPSSVLEVVPFPAGLNDCVSGLKWLHAREQTLNIDPARVIVAGDSGGGNLALATGLKLKRQRELGLVKGLYILSPLIAGEWPLAQNPSSIEYNGVIIETHNNRRQMYYGIDAWKVRDPLAWPGFATVEDVMGLPPTVIRVNEFDPLRDEGVNFYRLLLQAGVNARCHTLMGATHAIEVFVTCCPDISRDAALNIAQFCKVD
jgi:acetyl esterase/lipase